MKKRITKIVSILITLITVVAISGCSGPSVYSKVKKSGEIVLGTSADYPPYEFIKSVNGNNTIVGFDIEVAKEIAKDLGVKLVIKDMKFDGLLAALDAGNIDFVLAGMSPTAIRAKNVDFSNIYYKSSQTLVVRTADKDKFKTPSDLAGKIIDVQKGAIQEKIAEIQFPKAIAKALPKISDLVMSLQNSKADAAIIEGPVAKAYASKNSDIIISDVKIKNDEPGISVALKKNNPDLVALINKTLNRLVSTKSIEKFVGDANILVDHQ